MKNSMKQQSTGIELEEIELHPLAYQYLLDFYNSEAYLGSFEPITIGSVIPPKLIQGVKFDITSVMV